MTRPPRPGPPPPRSGPGPRPPARCPPWTCRSAPRAPGAGSCGGGGGGARRGGARGAARSVSCWALPRTTCPPAPRPAPGPGLAEATTGLGGAAGDLAAPELHTSLALGEEVRAAAHQGFDAHRAAQELLGTSFLARCSVEAKAAAGMNIPREQQLYQGLVSLQVPAEEVLSCALQEKLSLVRSQPEPHREPAPEGLDLLMFYEPRELFAETPYLGVEGLPPLRLQPHVRPPASTFLMFRKLQQWEA